MIVQRTDSRLTIVLAARGPRPIGCALLGALLGAPFLVIGCGLMIAFFAPSWFDSKPTYTGPFAANVVGPVIAFCFAGCFCLLGGAVVIGSFVAPLGRTEVHVWPGHIRSTQRLGPFRFFSTRSLGTLARLTITPDRHLGRPAREHEMVLEACFDDQPLLRLAKHCTAAELAPLAAEVRGSLQAFGGRAQVAVDVQSNASSRAALVEEVKAMARLTQQQRRLPPPYTRITIERPERGAVRFAIPAYRWWITMIPVCLGIAATIAFALDVGGIRHSGPRTLVRGDQQFWIDAVVTVLGLLTTAAVALQLMTRHVIDANAEGLTISSVHPLRTRVRRWSSNQIKAVAVDIWTTRHSKGGTSTHRALAVQPITGRRQRFLSDQSEANLQWIRTVVSEVTNIVEPIPTASNNSPTHAVIKPVRGVGVLLMLFASIFIIAGAWNALRQDYRLRHARPIDAVMAIPEWKMHSAKGAGRTERVPSYTYSIGGRSYTSDTVVAQSIDGPIESNLNGHVLTSMPAGTHVTAWLVNGDPEQSFLLRERLFTPYLFAMIGVGIFAMGLYMALEPQGGGTTDDAGISTMLDPPTRDRPRRKAVALVWIVSGMLAGAHFLLPPLPTLRWDLAVAVVLWLIGVIALSAWWREAARPAMPGSPPRSNGPRASPATSSTRAVRSRA